MKPASTYDDLLRAPVGRYLLARNLVLWCASPTLMGVVIGAEPQHEDVSMLLDLATRPLPPGLAANVDHVFDASRITRVDTDGFDTYLSGLARARAQRPRIHRHAIVRPQGFVGAVVAGTHTLLSDDTPFSVFTSAGEALDWLGCDRPALAGQLDALGALLTTGDPALAQVRSMLRATQFRLSLRDAARQLGIGPRTLQRVLRKHHTTFRHEIERERIAEAKRLLAETQLKLELIGERAGYGSAAHFSTSFLQHTGVSPSKWRQRTRAGITPLAPLPAGRLPAMHVSAPPAAAPAPTMHAEQHQEAC
jgi:AraC-like DNA-binding protein